MDKLINVRVFGSYMEMDSRMAGAQHEANATTLRLEFDQSWEGLAKSVTFWDAKGCNPTKRDLTTNMLEDITQSALVYLVPIPGEAMTESGEINFAVDGFIEGKRQRSFNGWLEVEESPYAPEAVNAANPTPTQVEQFQSQIESLMGDIQTAINAGAGSAEAVAAAEAARAGAVNAQTAAVNAMTGAQSARSAAETAQNAAETARDQAIAAKNTVDQAASDGVAAVQQTAQRVQTEIGEQVERAKYWSEQAQEIVGGDFATRTEVQRGDAATLQSAKEYTNQQIPDVDGMISTHNAAEDAHSDIRQAVNGKEMAGTAASVVTAHNSAADAHQDIRNAATAAQNAANNHAVNKQNPHGVTLAQIGAAASGHNHGGGVINPGAIELSPGTGAGHGGYIDFHFSGSAADHTSRIIEEQSGVIHLHASNGVKVGASNVAGLRVRNISVGTNELTEGAAATGYNEGDIRIVV